MLKRHNGSAFITGANFWCLRITLLYGTEIGWPPGDGYNRYQLSVMNHHRRQAGRISRYRPTVVTRSAIPKRSAKSQLQWSTTLVSLSSRLKKLASGI